jgi:ABC-2 type transport system ATP-binding protein
MTTPSGIVNQAYSAVFHSFRAHRYNENQMPAALEFSHITKEYRSFSRRKRVAALQDFSVCVERGEIFGFLGPNGAGKSTAIHLAMGLMRPSSGSGRMLERPFGDAATRRRVGFLAENVALYHRRAEAAIRFYGGLNGLHGTRLRDAARNALAAVGLEAEADRNLSQFSRGMLQRMGLAQALVNDPELLILDEPTSALDPAARVSVRELLLRWREQGKTIFLSSHLLSEVELVCDRVAILNRGRVVRMGTLNSMLATSDGVEIVARCAAGLFENATRDGDLTRIIVPTNEQRAVIERIWAAGGEVVSVNPVRRSLEDLFLELTDSQVAQPARPGQGKVL